MNEEIKEILNIIECWKNGDYVLAYSFNYDRASKQNDKLLDYITNLQQIFENSYTEEQLDFAVNEVKEQLKAEHQLTNQLHSEKDKLRVKNYELQQENERLKLELSGYREAILRDDKLLGLQQENEKLKKQVSEYQDEIFARDNNWYDMQD